MAAQYDAWSSLLETSEADVGWNWQGIFAYMKKVDVVTIHSNIVAANTWYSPSHSLPPMRGKRQKVPTLSLPTTEQQGPYK